MKKIIVFLLMGLSVQNVNASFRANDIDFKKPLSTTLITDEEIEQFFPECKYEEKNNLIAIRKKLQEDADKELIYKFDTELRGNCNIYYSNTVSDMCQHMVHLGYFPELLPYMLEYIDLNRTIELDSPFWVWILGSVEFSSQPY